MNTITVLHLIGASITLLFGIWAFFSPLQFSNIIRLTPKGKSGIGEIRATYGMMMIGLGAFAIWSQNDLIYQYLGIAWCAAAIGRTSSFILDTSFSKTNLRFVIVEIIMGLILIIGS